MSTADAFKAVIAGVTAVHMVSALLQRGPEYLDTVRRELALWMDEHGRELLWQMRGSMSHASSPNPNPGALERANYIRILQWGPI